jgi:hypothetical protein
VSVDDGVRDRIGQALSDVLAASDGTNDWHDSREIDTLADAAVAAIERDIEDGQMFRWIAENATISWDSEYKNAVVCFPVDADFFETIEDAVRKAMRPHSA